MKRYRFRLEQVRTVRRVQEEQARAELRRAERVVDQASGAADARRARYRGESTPAPAGPSGSFLADHERLARAASAVEAAGRALTEARQAAAGHQHQWTGAARRVAALDRLDERLRVEHAALVLRAMEQELGDVAIARRDGDD